jgi:hypothetical protein
LSFLHNYETRDLYERYGAIGYFNSEQNLTAIWWCHGQKLVTATSANAEWEHAKYVLRSSLLSLVTAKDH